MRTVRTGVASVACVFAGLAIVAFSPPARADFAARSARYCQNGYAEDLAALSPHARDIEARTPSYSYAVRTTATYECVSYGPDGNLRRTRTMQTAYGTAFGYRRDGKDTLLLTNEHVAEWPAVTDADHPVDGVPSGCKRVADALKIVDDDKDDYAADDIPLTRVVVDPQLDVAVLRAHTRLEIIPWKIGKSSALAARALVEVKGFPLGAFQATNIGKVVSAYDHDDQGDWDHDDFVVDALLTSGGSGSPVLAVSCATGEFELVGIFHARYNGASALNVVVAIDQVRELMTTLRRSPRPRPDAAVPLDGAARSEVASAARSGDPAFFPFGPNVAQVRVRPDGALVFAIYGSDFPRTSRPVLVVEDLPPAQPGAGAFGKLGAVYLGGAAGLVPYAAGEGDADSQALIARTLDGLRRDARAMFAYRAEASGRNASRKAFERSELDRKHLEHMLDAQKDLAQAISDLAARTGAPARPVSLAQIEADR